MLLVAISTIPAWGLNTRNVSSQTGSPEVGLLGGLIQLLRPVKGPLMREESLFPKPLRGASLLG